MAGEILDDAGGIILDDAGQAILEDTIAGSIATIAVTLKKMTISGIATGAGVTVTGAVKMNKMRILGTGEYPPVIVPNTPIKIVWDDEGSRIFETGIDRGVLYLPMFPGVPWDGLIKVAEAPSGGQAREYFLDGEKVLVIPETSEYAATLETYSSPQEFAPCAGLMQMSTGLFVANQPRQPFGLSYRTLVGDDLQGTSAGYKIHLVYNASAKSGDVTQQSLSRTPSVHSFSWTITTLPVMGEFGPTAHFVVDSRDFDPAIIKRLEDTLYGNDEFEPRFPSVQELLAILQIVIYDGTGAVTMKKMSIDAVGVVGSSGGGGLIYGNLKIKMKKMKVSGSGSAGTIDTIGIDLLPYLVSTGGEFQGADNTLILTVGANGGWPVIPGDVVTVSTASGSMQPTEVQDSQGHTYTKIVGYTGTYASTQWRAVATKGLQTADGPRGVADTFTITWANASQNKSAVVTACQYAGTADTAFSPTPAIATTTTPSLVSNAPAQSQEIIYALCGFTSGKGPITWGAGWHHLGTSPVIASMGQVSVAVRIGGSGPVTASATIGGTAGNTVMSVMAVRPLPVPKKLGMGASVFSPSYPGLGLNNYQSKARFEAVLGGGRKCPWIKRYFKEDQWDWPLPATGEQNVIEWTRDHGTDCYVSIYPKRAVGGGTVASRDKLRAEIIHWKNNGIAPHIVMFNEAPGWGAKGHFGDGSHYDADNSPYLPPQTEASAAQNYIDWFLWYGPTVIDAGLQAIYNPVIFSVAASLRFFPPRLQADGWPLCTGVSIDYYCFGDYGFTKHDVMDSIIAKADAMNPPCPVGACEIGATNGSINHPIDDNPAGTRSIFTTWLDNHVTGVFEARAAAGKQILPVMWFAQGDGNAIDYNDVESVKNAVRRLCDAVSE